MHITFLYSLTPLFYDSPVNTYYTMSFYTIYFSYCFFFFPCGQIPNYWVNFLPSHSSMHIFFFFVLSGSTRIGSPVNTLYIRCGLFFLLFFLFPFSSISSQEVGRECFRNPIGYDFRLRKVLSFFALATPKQMGVSLNCWVFFMGLFGACTLL